VKLVAPFSYFGGKSKIASIIWQALGDVPNFVDPFCGSNSVLFARPDEHEWWDRIETVNDIDGMLCNLWRAIKAAPDEVARWADWPIHECDLHARHAWLLQRKPEIQERLEGDPEWFDLKAAGWWLWGICIWIGSGWCSSKGPWQVREGRLVRVEADGEAGINRKRPHLTSHKGQGINRNLVAPIGPDNVEEVWSEHLREMMRRLSNRLRRVRITCGDWTRVLTHSFTVALATPVGVFLDPPYSLKERSDGLYAHDTDVSVSVREWALAHGDDPRFRIALCGYEGEHEMPGNWTVYRWKAPGGYAYQGEGRGRINRERECVWFSPHCIKFTLF
jgi:hypothetical protein